MKVLGVRVPDQVYDFYMKMNTKKRTEYLRKVLAEAAGMAYSEKKELFVIEDIVKRYIEENLSHFDIKEKEQIGDKNMTEKALDTIMQMMN